MSVPTYAPHPYPAPFRYKTRRSGGPRFSSFLDSSIDAEPTLHEECVHSMQSEMGIDTFKCNGALLSSVLYLINSSFRYIFLKRFLMFKIYRSINVSVKIIFKSNGALLSSVSCLKNASFRYF